MGSYVDLIVFISYVKVRYRVINNRNIKYKIYSIYYIIKFEILFGR